MAFVLVGPNKMAGSFKWVGPNDTARFIVTPNKTVESLEPVGLNQNETADHL